MASLIFGSQAFAVHDLDLFELDRNAVDNPATLGEDWSTLHGGGGSAEAFTGILDDISSPGNQFQGGGSKDNNDISQWLWKAGEPLDKDDITNAYAAAYVNTKDTGQNNVGDLIIYHGLDRFANNGSAQVGFWFLQDQIGLTNTPSGGGFLFSGVHTVGDILVQSNFSQGGVISSISVFKWVGSGGSHGPLNLLFSAQDCLTPGLGDDPACATVNQGNTPSPWPYTPKSGASGTFPQGSFYEGGINITRLVPDAGCFTGFLAETRTSTPFDARLKDFVTGNFNLCGINVTKTGDELSKVGDAVDYTVTIENTKALTLYKDDITDTLLGSITVNGVDNLANPYVQSNTCGATLLPGASCTITLNRTVLASDPDPLPNTVTVVYRGKSDLSGIAVSDFDDHSVNLFQPSITVTKTGDTLSKVGDEVNYTIKVCNTSSADTPDLVKDTVTDSLIGGVDAAFGASLASGQCESHDFTRTVQAGDPDPLVNTATAHYHPTGFPNDITASDDHSVNLFQPSVTIDKTGDELSKVGDEVHYTITVTNTSSPDSPNLTCAITDALLGISKPVNLASGAQDVTNASRVVLPGDPDPLVNTASVTCTVDGFGNVIGPETASHSVNLFTPSVEVIKGGPSSAHVGDTITYTFVINNTSSGDSPNLVLDSVTDTVIGNLTPEATTAGCGTLPPNGSCNFSKSYTVQASDPDPLVNVVTVHYHPAGFPNDITDNDDHSVRIERELAQLAHTATTCEEFITQTGNAVPPLTELTYGLQGGLINNVSPGVFFFYASHNVTGSQDQLVVDVVQRFSAANGDLTNDFQVHQDQAFLYRVEDSTCTKITTNVTTNIAGGQVVITFDPPGDVPTGTYVLGVKYSPSDALIGQPPCHGGATPCRYFFIPSRDGTEQTNRAQSFLFRER
ncbi:MAG TPA: hypothetical protein VFM85_02245 [Actinomycetota bacterium]|nr:hypothetical protein [Actinomycetota bacterium]